MSEAEFCLPVPLQHVDTDLSFVAHVGVKNLGQEIPLGWNSREVLPEDQTHSENATSKWSSLCQSIKNSSHEQYVLTVPILLNKKKEGQKAATESLTKTKNIKVCHRSSEFKLHPYDNLICNESGHTHTNEYVTLLYYQ